MNRFNGPFTLLIILFSFTVFAQTDGVLIDYSGNTRDNSAVLDVRSTTQGVLFPRLTTAQRTAISSPADALLVYDTDLNEYYRYDAASSSWKILQSGNTGFVQNQYGAQQASTEYWISGRGRMDGGLTVGAGATLDNNNTNNGSVANGALAFGAASGEGIASKRSAGGNQFGLDFYTQSQNRMSITNGGNVGIGTSGPIAQLHLADAFSAGYPNLLIGDDCFFTDIDVSNIVGLYGLANADRAGIRLGSDNSYIFGDNGYIGMGTTTPSATLHVIHHAFNTTPTSPTGNWAAIIENRQDAPDSRNGLSVVTRWGSNASKVFEAATYWNGTQVYTPILTVTGDQRVGIGTTTPNSRLQVNGSGDGGTYAYGYLASNGSVGYCGSCASSYSIWADGRIRAAEFNAMSDARIKKVIGKTPTARFLETVNRLEVTEYAYIDTIEYGTGSKQGFIAQQLEKVIPHAVKIAEDYIPNVFERASAVRLNGTLLTVMVQNTQDIDVGDKLKLYAGNQEIHAVVEKKTANSLILSSELRSVPDKVFVYGKMINDFRAVDYDQVFSIGIGAIQELSEENDRLKAELKQLKTQVNNLENLKAEVDRINTLLGADAMGHHGN